MVISLLHFEYLYKSIPQTNIERVCIWPLIYIILLKNQWLNAPNYSSAGFSVIFVSILMHTNFNSWHNFSVASDFNMISFWFCGSFWWRDCSVCGLVLCSKVDVAESAKSLIDNKDLGTLQWNILNKRISRWTEPCMFLFVGEFLSLVYDPCHILRLKLNALSFKTKIF